MPASIASVSHAAPCARKANTASAQGRVWRRSGGRPAGWALSFALRRVVSAGNVAATSGLRWMDLCRRPANRRGGGIAWASDYLKATVLPDASFTSVQVLRIWAFSDSGSET